MINKIFFIVLFSSLCAVGRADELVLKDGKVLQGTIVKEDAQEYTIQMRSNMVLRVSRDKIVKVNRSEPAKHARPTVRMDSLHAAGVKKSTATAAAPMAAKPSPVPPELKGIDHKTVKKDSVVYERTLMPGTTNACRVSWDGAPEKLRDAFKWKWAVVSATITVLPSAPAGLTEIYTGEAESFADAMAQLRAPDEKSLRAEGDRLYKNMNGNIEKKKKGFERRSKKPFDIPPK